MRARSLVGAAIAAGFMGVVVQVSAAHQCPASELGACARLHLELMRPRVAPQPGSTVEPLVLAAEPMRATTERG